MTPYIYPGLSERNQMLSRHGCKENLVDIIIASTCHACNIPRSTLLSKSQTGDVVEARCIAIGLISQSNCALTLQQLGQIFGRHHSSIIHMRKQFSNLSRYKTFTDKVEKVMGNI